MSIYADLILDHYQNPRNNKRIQNPTNTVHVNNPLCGDELDFDIIIDKGKVTEISFSGQGCAISTASASLLTEYVKGKSLEEVRNIDKKKVLELLGIELSPNRLKCGLLAWEGIVKVAGDVL